MMKTKRNPTISIARVIGMFFIITCHVSSWLGGFFGGSSKLIFNTASQIFNVGVFIFIFISGYLYADKKIKNNWQWLKLRLQRILIPMYVFLLFLFAILIFNPDISLSIQQFVIYLLNLQGISFVLRFLPYYYLVGAGHLWFLTIIMMCYLLLLILKQVEKKINFTVKHLIVIGMVALVTVILLSFASVYLNYFFMFLLGYFCGKHLKKITVKNYILISICMILCMVIRVYSSFTIDRTVIYLNIIVPITYDVLAVWIFTSIYFFTQNNSNILCRMAEHRLFLMLDNLSYYIYITHYMFLVGPLYVTSLTDNVWLGLLLFFVFTFVSAYILYLLCNGIYKLLATKKQKNIG